MRRDPGCCLCDLYVDRDPKHVCRRKSGGLLQGNHLTLTSPVEKINGRPRDCAKFPTCQEAFALKTPCSPSNVFHKKLLTRFLTLIASSKEGRCVPERRLLASLLIKHGSLLVTSATLVVTSALLVVTRRI